MSINLEILVIKSIEDDEKISNLNEKDIVSDMMLRRRLTRNARIALYLTDLLDAWDMPVVIGSAFGEVVETFEIIRSIDMSQTVSPTHFQNSVHNTPASYLSIVGNNTGYITTVSDIENTADCVLSVGAVKSMEYDKLLLIVVDAMGFDCFDDLNKCGVTKKEFGVAMVVQQTSKAPTITLEQQKFVGYSPSVWPMLEIMKKLSDIENIIQIKI
ncbi:MAG: beta-ketoacyl synthase chain length factor [Sulfurovaceae bacterium]|nr:beta-ketoacyl synthase chain length factor [Sulfurovaceae bacterium]